MKKILIILAVAVVAFGVVAFLVVGPDNDNEAPDNGKIKSESTAATEQKVYTYDDFIGHWVAYSQRADDLYGGYEITFNKNMTFDAVVTGEDESDSCTFEDGYVYLQGGILTQKFTFNEEGEMVMSGDGSAIVMTKKE